LALLPKINSQIVYVSPARKRFFKQRSFALPISDYASAFFFAHRKRVTFKQAFAHGCRGAVLEGASLRMQAGAFTLRKAPGFRGHNPKTKCASSSDREKNAAPKTKARRCRAF
jgi:hypothetical protein